MEFTYLVGEGQEALETIEAAEKQRSLFIQKAEDWEKQYPNIIGRAHNGSAGELVGIFVALENQYTEDQCKEFGFTPTPTTIEGQLYYKPTKRTKKGKQLQESINAINKDHIKFSKYIAKKLGIDTMQADAKAGRLYFTAVGMQDSKLFIKIPGTPNKDSNFPSLPAWVREPQGDEYKVFLK